MYSAFTAAAQWFKKKLWVIRVMSYTKPLLVGHQLFTVNSLSRECKPTPKVSQRSDIYVCFSFTFLCLCHSVNLWAISEMYYSWVQTEHQEYSDDSSFQVNRWFGWRVNYTQRLQSKTTEILFALPTVPRPTFSPNRSTRYWVVHGYC